MTKYEYIYAPDVFDDDNEGYLYGVQEVGDFPDYVEWFKTIKQLEQNSKKNKMKITNREMFLNSIKKMRKDFKKKKSKINKEESEEKIDTLGLDE